MQLALVCRQIGHYHDARFRAAAERFDDFSVISAANEGGFSEFLARDVGAYAVSRLFAGQRAFRSAVLEGKLSAAVAEALDAVRPDVVAISGWAAPEGLSTLRWARRRGVSVVLMSESQAFDAPNRSPVKEFLKSLIVRQCDAALVGGPTHRDYVVALGMDRSRVTLGYDAVCNDHFSTGADAARQDASNLRAQLGLPSRYLLASARFITKKNLPALIGAYESAVSAVGDGPDLVILGDGAERTAVEAAVRAHRLEGRVHLPGFRGYDVLPAYYGLAEAFVHVSLVEQWGLVVNEAMAAGLPVIVSKTCGASALVQPGLNGFLVDAADPGDLAAGLTRLLQMEPGERAVMGDAARETMGSWGPSQFGDGLLTAAKIASSRPRRTASAPWDAALLDRLSRMLVEDVA